MKALDVLNQEHLNIWRISFAIDTLMAQMKTVHEKDDLAALSLMLDYFDKFVHKTHHPKEEAVLFRILVDRSKDAVEVVQSLREDHANQLGMVAAIRRKMALAKNKGSELDENFRIEVEAFTASIRFHIEREEKILFPIARTALSGDDWKNLEGVFAHGADPLSSEYEGTEFDDIQAKLVHLVPAPIGLGGITETLDKMVSIPSVGKTLLEVDDLSSHYDRIAALRGVSLKVAKGQLVALVGANGAGKTTLLRALSGVKKISAGAVMFDGIDISTLSPEKRVRLGICQVPEGRQMFSPMSVEDNIKLGAYTREAREIKDSLARMYSLFPILAEKRNLQAGALSGGQQQMLAMARALMGKPRLLLLDEPSMGLAPMLVHEVFRVIGRLKSEGITILLVEQNAFAALSVADVGYVLETGKVTLSGRGTDLLQNPDVKKAYLGM